MHVVGYQVFWTLYYWNDEYIKHCIYETALSSYFDSSSQNNLCLFHEGLQTIAWYRSILEFYMTSGKKEFQIIPATFLAMWKV